MTRPAGPRTARDAVDVPTQRGIPLTDELLDAIVEEAEAGFTPDQFRGPGRPRLGARGRTGPSVVVQVRIDDDLHRQLDARAERDAVTVSEVVRSALRAHLGGAAERS